MAPKAPAGHADVRERLGEEPPAKGGEPEADHRLPPSAPGTPGGKKAPLPALPEVEDDIRTLEVTWDEHGERYKARREVVAQCTRYEFGDWAERFDAAPPAVLGLIKRFLRFGGDPLRWKDEWLRELGMHGHERTAIEVAMITRCLHYMGTYDQLNLPSLASAEVLCQRLAQLIEAHASGDRNAPN